MEKGRHRQREGDCKYSDQLLPRKSTCFFKIDSIIPSVSLQDYAKTTGRIPMKFCGRTRIVRGRTFYILGQIQDYDMF